VRPAARYRRGISLKPAPEYRALKVFDKLPPGCWLLAVPNDDSHPHLRCAEFAVVDTNDREPARGELFVIRYNGGTPRERLAIVMLFARECQYSSSKFTGWWSGSLCERQRLPDGTPSRYVDGPLLVDAMRERRVIGVWGPVALPAA